MARAVTQKKATKTSQIPAGKFWQGKFFAHWVVFIAAFLLFANSIRNGYNMDDELVTINHRLTAKGISAIPEIFSSHYYSDNQGYSYEYRPVVLATFAIEHQFLGDNAHVSHFFNVLFYALCCVVLLQVLLKLFKSYSPLLALAVTLFFIVHPSHTEVVSSIKNRDEILGILFSLLALLAAIKGIESEQKGWFVGVPICFALGLMAKATVIAFILIIPIALVLFTEASWGLVLLSTILLILPSFVFLTMNSPFVKLLLFFAVIFSVLAVYAVVNFESFRNGILIWRNRIRTGLFSSISQVPDESTSGTTPSNLLNTLKSVEFPDKSLISIKAITLTGFLAAFYMVSSVYLHFPFALVSMVILIILAWKGQERIAWWAIFMIGACLVSNIAVYPQVANSIFRADPYCGLVAAYLIAQLRFGKKSLALPMLIMLILSVYLRYYTFHNTHIIFAMVILFINKKYKPYNLALILVVAGLTAYSVIHHNVDTSHELVMNSIYIVVLLLFQNERTIKLIPFIAVITALLIFHLNQFESGDYSRAPQILPVVENISSKIEPKIISSPQDRPLMYVEECVDYKTPASIRLGTSFHVLGFYLLKVVFPYPLSYYYGYKFIYPQNITETIPLLSAIAHLLLLLTAIFFLKKERLLSFGLIIYLVSVAIFSNYLQPVPGMVGDRFLLIPSFGWALVLAVILQKIFKVYFDAKATSLPQISKNAKYVFAGILLLYGGFTFSRNMDWYDDITLMRHDIEVVPQSVQAQNLLAIHLVKNSFAVTDPILQKPLREEALGHLRIANSLYPGYFNFNYDLGRIFRLLNMADSSLFYFKQAFIIKNNYPDVQINIADIDFAKNDYPDAIPYLVQAVQQFPDNYTFADKLSFAYFKTNQPELSIKTNIAAIDRLPSRVDPYINIATTYNENNHKDSAVVWLNRALVVSPGNPNVLNFLKRLQ